MTKPSNARSRLLSLIVLVTTLTVLASIAIAPFLPLDELNRTIDERKALLSQLQQRAEAAVHTHQQEAKRFSPRKLGRLLLAGGTLGIASANLQKQVRAIVEQHDGEVSSAQVLLPKEEGDLLRITVRFSLRVTNESLRDVLYTLETRMPFTFVEEISVQSANPQQHARARIATPAPLNVTFDISGFFISDKAS